MRKSCLVIPCYNESKRLRLDQFAYNLETDTTIHYIFVDDGSTDATGEKLRHFTEANPERVRYLTLFRNRGKSEAVRQGVLTALKDNQFDFIGYLDADLSTPLSQIILLHTELTKRKSCRLVFGSRFLHLGVTIIRNPVRHYCGRIFATLTSLLLALPVYDTQCGAKFMQRDTAAELFSEPFGTRFFFDVELLARMIKFHGRTATLEMVVELPLREWTDKGDSRIPLLSFITAPIDLLKIYWQYFK